MVKALVFILELAPEIVVLNVSFTEFTLVIFTHLKLSPLWIPDENFLDTRRAWSNVKTIARNIFGCIPIKVHIVVFNQLRIIAQKLRLLFLLDLV